MATARTVPRPDGGSARKANAGEPLGALRSFALWGTSRIAAGAQRVRGNRCTDGFGILMYHRVAEATPGADKPTWNVTPRRLHRQLSGLLSRGFEPWPLARLVDAHRAGDTIPATAFAVTFDDGYRNNLSQALPVLRDLRVPATIFLATGYLGSERPFPFDDWSAAGTPRVPADSWRPLAIGECRELLDSGLVSLGAHTHRHENFAGRPAEFASDLATCLNVLRDEFGIERPAFAFPFGASDGAMMTVARQSGVRCALTTAHRRVGAGDGEFGWSRFNVQNGDSPAVLAAKLSGWYETVAAIRNAVARPLLPQHTWSKRAPRTAESAAADLSLADTGKALHR